MKKKGFKPKPKRKTTWTPATIPVSVPIDAPKISTVSNVPRVNVKSELRKILKAAPKFGNTLQYPREWGDRLYPELLRFMVELQTLAE